MKLIDNFIKKIVERIIEKIESELKFNRDTRDCMNCEHKCGKFVEWLDDKDKIELKSITFCSEFKQRKW